MTNQVHCMLQQWKFNPDFQRSCGQSLTIWAGLGFLCFVLRLPARVSSFGSCTLKARNLLPTPLNPTSSASPRLPCSPNPKPRQQCKPKTQSDTYRLFVVTSNTLTHALTLTLTLTLTFTLTLTLTLTQHEDCFSCYFAQSTRRTTLQLQA